MSLTKMNQSRADAHSNPTAFIVDLARQAGLVLGVDYSPGEPFPTRPDLQTARLLGDPINLTIVLIDRVGFYTQHGAFRWNYIAIPTGLWSIQSRENKIRIIGGMYRREGGVEMRHLFPTPFIF